jgi:hypothetical protein
MKFAIHTFIQGLLLLFIGSKYIRMITQYIQYTQIKKQAYIHTSGNIQYRNSHYRLGGVDTCIIKHRITCFHPNNKLQDIFRMYKTNYHKIIKKRNVCYNIYFLYKLCYMIYFNSYKLMINYCYLIELAVQILQIHQIRTIDHHHLTKGRKKKVIFSFNIYIKKKVKTRINTFINILIMICKKSR